MKDQPVRFKGALIARITAARAEAGTHGVKIRFVTEDGGSVMPDLKTTFEVPPKGGPVQMVLDLSMTLPRLGKYEFSLAVDNLELDTWPLEAREAKPKKE